MNVGVLCFRFIQLLEGVVASYIYREGQVPGRLQRVQVTNYPLVECLWLLPRFNLGSNVVSAKSIRMILNSESLTNVLRTVLLIVSNVQVMSIPSMRDYF